MRSYLLRVSAIILLAQAAAGCDKLGIDKLGITGQQAAPDAPAEEELRKISYMSATEAGGKRKQYTRYEEARSCKDLEVAMRWNRPPNVEAGPFHQKMTYVTAGIPADFQKNTEVFIRASIEKGETLPSGSAGWYLRLRDGSRVQVVEMANFLEKEEQSSQPGKPGAFVQPNRPGRVLCGNGVYEGRTGKDPDQSEQIPLISMMFAMDRDK